MIHLIGEFKDSFSQSSRPNESIKSLNPGPGLVYHQHIHRSQVLDRKAVLLKLWGDDNFFNTRTMDVFITKLRKHLRQDASVEIINMRGVGYKLIF